MAGGSKVSEVKVKADRLIWTKAKCRGTQHAWIGGWTYSDKGFNGLLLGVRQRKKLIPDRASRYRLPATAAGLARAAPAAARGERIALLRADRADLMKARELAKPIHSGYLEFYDDRRFVPFDQ